MTYCLDLTRLVSRVGRGSLTGVDRVELAYLKWLLQFETNVFFLINIGELNLILDHSGGKDFLDKMLGAKEWGKPSWHAAAFRRRSQAWRRAYSDLYRLAIARCRNKGLSRALKKRLPQDVTYLNVGHSNLKPNLLRQMKVDAGWQIQILIHDTIPLDFPQFQSKENPNDFEQKLRCAAEFADRLICISKVTLTNVERYLDNWGLNTNLIVAHIGVDIPVPGADLLADLDINHPYFVVLGTIEPRKNHRFLLRLWEQLQGTDFDAQLVIVGRRGWESQDLFDRLDKGLPGVVELNQASDETVASVIANSVALLFPSYAEGFGLPSAEAATLGIPVICSNLDVFKEILGDYPVYADIADMYQWETIIRNCVITAESVKQGKKKYVKPLSVPSWDSHFNIVLNLK